MNSTTKSGLQKGEFQSNNSSRGQAVLKHQIWEKKQNETNLGIYLSQRAEIRPYVRTESVLKRLSTISRAFSKHCTSRSKQLSTDREPGTIINDMQCFNIRYIRKHNRHTSKSRQYIGMTLNDHGVYNETLEEKLNLGILHSEEHLLHFNTEIFRFPRGIDVHMEELRTLKET